MGQSGSGGTFGVTRLWATFEGSGVTFGGTCGVTRVWACLWVSRLGPRCRSPGASPRCRRLRWIVSSSPLRPRRGRRHPDAPRPPRRRACHRSIVSPQSLSPALRCRRFVVSVPAPAVARSRGCPPASRPPSSRLSPLRRRVITSSSSEPKPTVERSSVAAERPLAVARRPRRAPPVATRRLCVVATTPSSVVVVVVVARCLRRHRRRRPRRQHSRPRVALPLCGRPCGLRRHLRPRRYRRLSSSGRHRRPPPVAAVVVVDPRLYPHPSSCSATLPPASLTWDWDVTRRRRRRVVVVLAAALWSSSSSGLVLAAAGWQCFDVGAGQGTEHDRTPGPNMRATPALPIPRFCSEHQNNVNQTSAFGPCLLLRRGLAQLQILFLTDSQDCTHRHALLSAQLCRRLGGAVQSLGCYFRVPVRCELVLLPHCVPDHGVTILLADPHRHILRECSGAEPVCTFAGLPVGQELL